MSLAQLEQSRDAVWSYVTTPEGIAVAALCFAVAVGIAWGIREIKFARDQKYFEKWVPKLRESAIKKHRAKFVRQLVASDCATIVEKRVWDGTLSRHEANQHFYYPMRKLTGNHNYMPPARVIDRNIKELEEKRQKAAVAEQELAKQRKKKNQVSNVVSLNRPVTSFGATSRRRLARG